MCVYEEYVHVSMHVCGCPQTPWAGALDTYELFTLELWSQLWYLVEYIPSRTSLGLNHWCSDLASSTCFLFHICSLNTGIVEFFRGSILLNITLQVIAPPIFFKFLYLGPVNKELANLIDIIRTHISFH